MRFNYVLYVPEDIEIQYRNGGGGNPNSGNPFWWYMKTYYGMSLNKVTGDWAGTISSLCSQDYPPQADSQDVSFFWKLW